MCRLTVFFEKMISEDSIRIYVRYLSTGTERLKFTELSSHRIFLSWSCFSFFYCAALFFTPYGTGTVP